MKQTAQRRGTSTPQKTTTKVVRTQAIYKVIAPANNYNEYIIRYVVASSEKSAARLVYWQNDEATEDLSKYTVIKKTK